MCIRDRTIRFHYVNAKSYNADFDGDEMNIHVPQTLECRAELETLMDANLNYIAPTSGKPIRGLIQDHVASAVYLTLKDTFFTPDAFIQLVYTGLQPYLGSITSGTSDLAALILSLIHISEPTRLLSISYAVFCLKKKKKQEIQTKLKIYNNYKE
eukprot:TRINITY_DN5001_c0_g1_i2.p1 TRINITY_DN5001_c0_g1~~TRINITY_DN5001_c0_g1_i2.p1  ORF type:complete len:155 (+),score=54.26 TRINITY_DN5001_c0_g1_i2:173-637(+)